MAESRTRSTPEQGTDLDEKAVPTMDGETGSCDDMEYASEFT